MADVSFYRFWSANYFPLFEIPVVDSFKPAIRNLFPHELGELFLDVSLIPEPNGPHGPGSISVRAEGNTIGYLPVERAKTWAGPVRRVIASGLLPATRAQVFTVGTSAGNRMKFLARIQIGLRDTVDALPSNDPPPVPYTMLPHSSFTKVARGGEYLAAVLPLVPPGGRGMFFATLHERPPVGGRGSKPIVEVRIDQRCVGELTPQMSQRYLPMIQHLRERGLVSACCAEITGSSVSAEVRIYAVKANEVDDGFLNGDPVVLPRLVPQLDDPQDYDLEALADHLWPRPLPNATAEMHDPPEPESTNDDAHEEPASLQAAIEATRDTIRASAKVRDSVRLQSVRNLVLALVAGVGGLAAGFKWISDGATAQEVPPRLAVSAESEMAKTAIMVFRLADLLGLDLVKAVGRKLNSTFVLFPASAASSPEHIEDVLRRTPERSAGGPPVELVQMLDGVLDRCRSSISIDRPPDADGAVATVFDSRPESLNVLFEATKGHAIAAYDIGLKRLYNPHGSVSVRLLLGGEVVIPYATTQLLDDVVRNPNWPNPDAPFVIIDRGDPGNGERYIQTYLNDDGSYTLEYRDGSSDQHYGYETSEPALVSDAMWSWIVEDYQRLRNLVTWERQEYDT